MELFLFFSILGLMMGCAAAYFITDFRDLKRSRINNKIRDASAQPQQANPEG